MYRCECCGDVQKPRAPMLRHTVKRRDGSIEREIATCLDCKEALKHGVPLDTLIKAPSRYSTQSKTIERRPSVLTRRI